VLNTGNPFFPFAYDLFGGRNWDALGDEYHTRMLESTFTAEIPKTLVGLAQPYYYRSSSRACWAATGATWVRW